jgi:hypothetical protein
MVNRIEAISSLYDKYIRICLDTGINYEVMYNMRYNTGFYQAFDMIMYEFLTNSFKIKVKEKDLFIEAMNSIKSDYSFEEVMSIVKHINQVDAFKISLAFVEYDSASDIPNRFICEENMPLILNLFPNAKNDKTINKILRINSSVNPDDFVYEYIISEIDDIEHQTLDYMYGKIDVDEINNWFPIEYDEEYEISEELLLTSLNSNFPEELLQKAFESSIMDNGCLEEWHWLSNPNQKIRESYLEFIAKNEEKVAKFCNGPLSKTIVGCVLSYKLIDYSDIEYLISLLKKKESIFSEDFVFSIEEMVDDSSYVGYKSKLILLLEKRYNELEKLEKAANSKEKPITETPINKKDKITNKITSDDLPVVNHLGSVAYRNKTPTNKCETVVETTSSSKSTSNQKTFKKTNLVRTEYKKPNEAILELDQAKTRVISKQLIKLTSEPIKSFLLSKKIDNSMIEGFIDSKYFNSVVGAALFAGGNNISFNNKSLENAKNEVFQEIKIESIASFGNEIVDIVKGSLIGVVEKFASKKRNESKENIKSNKPKKLSDGKKANNKISESKKVNIKSK